MSAHDRPEIEDAVKNLAQVHGKKPTQASINHWVERIEARDLKTSLIVLKRACDDASMPSLEDIMQRIIARSKSMPEDTKPLTSEEKKRADYCAVISMLWLHYTKPAGFQMVGDLFVRLFGGDPIAALEKAKTIYTREDVEKLMNEKLARLDREQAQVTA